MNHKKELLRSLWVVTSSETCSLHPKRPSKNFPPNDQKPRTASIIQPGHETWRFMGSFK